MSERIPMDAYYTPDECAAACVSKLDIGPQDTCWEPHAGGGAFVRALINRNAKVVASDIDPQAPGLANGEVADAFVGDFFNYALAASWIVGNPPYRDVERHIRHALAIAPNVAFLCRLALLESRKRASLWEQYPPTTVYVLRERPSFVGGVTDNSAYGFFVWEDWHKGPTKLDWISWRSK